MSEIDVDRLAGFTLDLIGIESPSGKEDRVARRVVQEMDRLGFQVSTDALGNVVGSLEAGPGPTLLFDAHMDTVGVTDASAWSRPPTGAREGGILYGRGAMDMKGPLAACLYGLASLKGRLLRGKVVLSASISEELVEGPFLVEVAKRVRPEAAVICEATSLGLAVGQRGRIELMLEVFGRPTHSSRPELGINAALAAVSAVSRLQGLEPPSHSVLGKGVLVLTDIISRPHPGLSVVPDACFITYDRRTLPGEEQEAILAPVDALVQAALAGSGATHRLSVAEDDITTYTGARLTAKNFAPAWYTGPDHPLAQAALRGMGAVGLAQTITHYAFCTNGSGTAALNIPTVGFGPGEEAQAHRIDEHIRIQDLAMAASGYAAIAEAFMEFHPWA